MPVPGLLTLASNSVWAVAAPLHGGGTGLLDEIALLAGGLLVVGFTLWFLLRPPKGAVRPPHAQTSDVRDLQSAGRVAATPGTPQSAPFAADVPRESTKPPQPPSS